MEYITMPQMKKSLKNNISSYLQKQSYQSSIKDKLPYQHKLILDHNTNGISYLHICIDVPHLSIVHFELHTNDSDYLCFTQSNTFLNMFQLYTPQTQTLDPHATESKEK